ncbi:hypothetical protein [Hyperthermus butylicus]|uniref:Uncharacterized protein n=1 Tax=Hyperthermus butylicus (strain DSM 5456 / JCM 9403 / PLM1-5) TaxID=415426 RepID=A2BM48_HYPBU|nr:hypothetical protein [Hyperthermus butylicus]ABM81059.1 hypothetical protein Hbut_1227 [Hyperthermus butylicus DSM 5456]
MPNLIALIVESAILGLAYLVLHEALHYAAARILGFGAELAWGSDSFLPSPSVIIHGSPTGWRRLAILYLPYIINAVFILSGMHVVRLIGLLTLPNMLLEEDNDRSLRLPFAVGLQALIIGCVVVLNPCM